MYYCLPKSQLNRLQHIQNALARAVVAAPRSSNPDHILRSLHWLKVHERIEFKVISTTYKVLQSSSPRYLRDLIKLQPFRSTRSSTLVTLLQPSVHSSLKITNRSFRHAAPHLWNNLPPTLRAPSHSSSSPSSSSFSSSLPSSSPSSVSDPVLGISNGAFHSHLKTFLFSKSFPP